MKLRYLIPAAFLFLAGCGTKHNIHRDIYHETKIIPSSLLIDSYTDMRNDKTYDDYYSRIGKPDGKLNAVHTSNQKIIIDYECAERDTTMEWDIQVITIPAGSPEATELQKDFEKVKSDYKEQEKQKALSKSSENRKKLEKIHGDVNF